MAESSKGTIRLEPDRVNVAVHHVLDARCIPRVYFSVDERRARFEPVEPVDLTAASTGFAVAT